MLRNSAADGGSVTEQASTMLKRPGSAVYEGEPFVGAGGFGWKKNLRMDQYVFISLVDKVCPLRMVILSEAYIYIA